MTSTVTTNSVLRTRARRLSETVRTARLSELCFAERVRRFSTANFLLEVFTAVVSSTAVGSWAIWHADEDLGIGQILWRVLSATLVIVTIVKPMLKLQDKIKAATERLSEYHAIYIESLALADDVRANDGFYTSDVLAHEELLAKKLSAVEGKSAEEEITIQATRKWKVFVEEQYPKSYFWFPTERTHEQAEETSGATQEETGEKQGGEGEACREDSGQKQGDEGEARREEAGQTQSKGQAAKDEAQGSAGRGAGTKAPATKDSR